MKIPKNMINYREKLYATFKATTKLEKKYDIIKMGFKTHPLWYIYDALDKDNKIYEIKVTTNEKSYNALKKNPFGRLSVLQKENIKKLDYIIIGYCNLKGKIIECFKFDVKKNENPKPL